MSCGRRAHGYQVRRGGFREATKRRGEVEGLGLVLGRAPPLTCVGWFLFKQQEQVLVNVLVTSWEAALVRYGRVRPKPAVAVVG